MSGSISNWAALKEKFRAAERCVDVSCRDRSGPAVGTDGHPVPPDRAEIGRSAWRYIHTLAANHPEQATRNQQAEAQAWLTSFVQLYPCSHCAEAFVEVCETMPPNFKTGRDYSMWWCQAHNAVSDTIGNEPRRCDPLQLKAAGNAGHFIDEMFGPEATALEGRAS